MTKEEWLKENGFNENEETYISPVVGTYVICDAVVPEDR